MSQQLTLQQVRDHNTQVPFDKWAIIHGEVYRLAQIPFDQCLVTAGNIANFMDVNGNPDVSGLFPIMSPIGGSDLAAVQNAAGCHVGTLQGPSATPQGSRGSSQVPGQSPQGPQGSQQGTPLIPTPNLIPQAWPQGMQVPPQGTQVQPQGTQGQSPRVPQGTPQIQQAGQGQPAPQNTPSIVLQTPGQTPRVPQGTPSTVFQTPGQTPQNQQGAQGQPAPQNTPSTVFQTPPQSQADAQRAAAAAERQRLEDARNRRLRRAYNPLQQDPDDVGEYPADAVAMGYLPDLDGRRWRERRMRLRRFAEYIDGRNIDDADVDRTTEDYLDLDFKREIVYRRHLRGGEKRHCTGAFRAARPPPRRDQIHRRYNFPRGGPPQSPGPWDPPDSDDGSDHGDGGGGGGDGDLGILGQVNTNGRVRPWAPSTSSFRATGPSGQPTPPITPARPAGQNNQAGSQDAPRKATQPPPRPTPDPQEPTLEEQQEIARQTRQREKDAADQVLAAQAHQAQVEAWAQEDSQKQQGTGVDVGQQQAAAAEQRKQQAAAAAEQRKQQAAAAQRQAYIQRNLQQAQQDEQARKDREASNNAAEPMDVQQTREKYEEQVKKATERAELDRQNDLTRDQNGRKQASGTPTGPPQPYDPASPEAIRDSAEQVQDTFRRQQDSIQKAMEESRKRQQQVANQQNNTTTPVVPGPKSVTVTSGKYRDQQQRIQDLISAGLGIEDARDEVAREDRGLVDKNGKLDYTAPAVAGPSNTGRKSPKGPPRPPTRPPTTTPRPSTTTPRPSTTTPRPPPTTPARQITPASTQPPPPPVRRGPTGPQQTSLGTLTPLTPFNNVGLIGTGTGSAFPLGGGRVPRMNPDPPTTVNPFSLGGGTTMGTGSGTATNPGTLLSAGNWNWNANLLPQDQTKDAPKNQDKSSTQPNPVSVQAPAATGTGTGTDTDWRSWPDSAWDWVNPFTLPEDPTQGPPKTQGASSSVQPNPPLDQAPATGTGFGTGALSEEELGNFYADLAVNLPIDDVDDWPMDDPVDDADDLIAQAFQNQNRFATARPSAANANSARTPQPRWPADLFTGNGGARGAAAATRKLPPPGGIRTTSGSSKASSSAGGKGRVAKKGGSGSSKSTAAGSTLRSGKTRQTRQTKR